MTESQNQRIVSGMRATGRLHLGHYHGVLKNWVELQHRYDCYFFVADWHALTTHYEHTQDFSENSWNILIDWLAAGLNPQSACLFLQSRVPQHAELFLLLSMVTPLSWLERIPTYKDQQEKLKELDLSTYGFLGYPLLQSADILLYKPTFVPVGEDQVSHVEMTREVARRFNHLFGGEPDFADQAEHAILKLGKKNADLYHKLRKRYQEKGHQDAFETAMALVDAQVNLSLGDKERLKGYVLGSGRLILTEPQVLLTPQSKMPGLDGQKMSKSYKNTIDLRDDTETVTGKVRKMPTDPARVRRSDPGEPTKCPVWEFHKVYSDETAQNWVLNGCRSAGIGCLECKQVVIDGIEKELTPIRERAEALLQQPEWVRNVIEEGCENAAALAEETLDEVREAMGLAYEWEER